jgi:hypothetical protein
MSVIHSDCATPEPHCPREPARPELLKLGEHWTGEGLGTLTDAAGCDRSDRTAASVEAGERRVKATTSPL